MSPKPAAVSVRGLVKRYGRTTAVDGLDLELPPGTVLALLGPNGAGKTTAVEVCTGFLRADAGEVRVLGVDPAGAPDALRSRIGVMPQGGGAYPTVRAAEMLRVVAACSAHPLDVGWLSTVLGLDGCARTPYKRLSGGQQQRLSLACAVVGRPELVFLDEPTAGMDPQGRRLVWELIEALRRDGVSVLLTTHLMEEAEALWARLRLRVGDHCQGELCVGAAGGWRRFWRIDGSKEDRHLDLPAVLHQLTPIGGDSEPVHPVALQTVDRIKAGRGGRP